MPESRSSSLPTVLSIVVLIGIIGYAVYQKIEHKTQPATTVPFNSIAYVTIAKQEEGQVPEYTLDIEYPEFKGLGKIAEETLNALIATSAHATVAAFKRDLVGTLSNASDTPPSTLSMRYRVAEASDRIISVVFDTSAYTAGAAHPNNFISTFNYRVDTGAPFVLSDLFKKDSAYLAILAPLARERLLANPQVAGVVSATWLDQGTATKPENFSTFTLTSQGLTIYFNPYQVAAYAAGVITVTIPLPELSDIADPEGPLSQLLK